MRIKAFAAATGLPAHTIRYYERYGLLQPAREGDRGGNGYRAFTKRDIAVAQVIKHARRLGVPLATIREHLASFTSGEMATDRLEALFAAQLRETEARLREFEDYRGYLTNKLWLLRSGEWSAKDFAAAAAREVPTGTGPADCAHG